MKSVTVIVHRSNHHQRLMSVPLGIETQFTGALSINIVPKLNEI